MNIMKVKIEVRKDHIDAATKCDSRNCAIAIAVRDIFPDANVGRLKMFLAYNMYTEIQLPDSARGFIRSFDAFGQKCKPFNFEIDLSDKVIDALCMPDLLDLLKDVDNMELIEA